MAEPLKHIVEQPLATYPLESVLAGSLEERWHRYADLLKKTRSELSEKENLVHDLRVASRRLVSTIDLVKPVAGAERLVRIRKQLRRGLKVCSPLRDLQVQVPYVRSMVLEYPALETFLTVVLLREKRVMRQIVRALQKVQPGKMAGDLASVAAQVRTLLSQPVVREAAHAAVVGAAGIAVLRGRERFSMIHRDDTASIHLFRVAFKKMRYTMEALRPLFPSVTEEQLKVMDNYQQKMGDIQDVEVLRASINAYASWRHETNSPALLAVGNELMRRRSFLIQRFMDTADDFYLFWPSELKSTTSQPYLLRTRYS